MPYVKSAIVYIKFEDTTHFPVAFIYEALTYPHSSLIRLSYSFAWVGHFFFEKNKPATFTYAIFSLMGDFRMLYDTYRAMILGS